MAGRSFSRVIALVAGVVLCACAISTPSIGAATSKASDAGWMARDSGTKAPLYDLACPTALGCIAVGGSASFGGPPTVLTTNDGGQTWSSHQSPGKDALDHVGCSGLSWCAAFNSLGHGPVMVTTNGGLSWTALPQPAASPAPTFSAIACPAPEACLVVDLLGTAYAVSPTAVTPLGTVPKAPGGIVEQLACPKPTMCIAAGWTPGGAPPFAATTDGGRSWAPTSYDLPPNSLVDSLSCPTADRCFAAAVSNGAAAHFLTSSDGGLVWNQQSAPPPGSLRLRLSCFDAKHCVVATSEDNPIFATSDAGMHWSAQAPRKHPSLYAISCPTLQRCMTVGLEGTLLATERQFG
jgi:photosystem II stability/assembly factor-like uncharacterized protein